MGYRWCLFNLSQASSIRMFLSEVSLALYLLPAMFGGIGINVISHVLIDHLLDAEKRFRDSHPDA